jgi:alkylated DNA nucleotide flippase Atl1
MESFEAASAYGAFGVENKVRRPGRAGVVAHRNEDENKSWSRVVALFGRHNASPRPQNVKKGFAPWWKVKRYSGKAFRQRDDCSEAFQ